MFLTGLALMAAAQLPGRWDWHVFASTRDGTDIGEIPWAFRPSQKEVLDRFPRERQGTGYVQIACTGITPGGRLSGCYAPKTEYPASSRFGQDPLFVHMGLTLAGSVRVERKFAAVHAPNIRLVHLFLRFWSGDSSGEVRGNCVPFFCTVHHARPLGL
jgi:hypothetical protein